MAGGRQRGGGDGLCVGTVLRVSGAGFARSVCLRPRSGAGSDPGQSESRPRGPRQARLARGPDDRRASDDPWASRGAPASSSPVRSLRRARRYRGQVRLREPADAGRADEGDRARTASTLVRVFRIAGPRKDTSIALLWAKEDGYWKIVSWQTAPKPDETPVPPAPPEPKVVRIKADLTLVHAAKNFLDTWLIRKNYDAAFRYLSTRSYACYDLVRGPDAPRVNIARRCRPEDPRKSRTHRPMGWHADAIWRRSSRLPSRSTRRFV